MPILRFFFSFSWLAGVVLLLVAGNCRADLIDLVPNPNSPIPGVQTSVSGTFNSPDGSTTAMTTVGVGQRKKRFLGALLKIYVAQLLVSDTTQWNKADPLGSISKMKASAMVLTTERAISSSELVDAFNAGLDANQITADEEISALLDLLSKSGDIQSGATVMFCFETFADGTELLSYRDSAGAIHTLKSKPGLTHSIFSIWLGVPSDDQLADLKSQLLGGQS